MKKIVALIYTKNNITIRAVCSICILALIVTSILKLTVRLFVINLRFHREVRDYLEQSTLERSVHRIKGTFRDPWPPAVTCWTSAHTWHACSFVLLHWKLFLTKIVRIKPILTNLRLIFIMGQWLQSLVLVEATINYRSVWKPHKKIACHHL